MNYINTFYNEKIGFITDIVLDKPLDEETFNKLYKQILDQYGLMLIQLKNSEPLLRILPVKRGGSRVKQLVLLAVTLVTIFLTGYGLSESFYSLLDNSGAILYQSLVMGLIYTVLFISALGLHEYGHMRAARRDNVVINGPYFIPAPPIQLGFIGTLGAVISMKTLPPSRKSLARIGLAGPVNGYIAGLIISVIGILLSPLISVEQAEKLIESGEVGEIGFMPLTLALLLHLRNIPDGYTIILHPLAFIGFVIFIVTFLNLIPIGQLDGGHVIRSYISMKRYELLGYMVIIGLLMIGLLLGGDIGLYYIALSIIMIVLKIIIGRHPHPGPANQYSRSHSYKYLIVYIILVTLTLPIPV